MAFGVSGSTRGGAVSARSGTKMDPREEHYNLDPGAGIYRPVQRRLTVSAGPGLISAELVTASEYTRFNDSSKQCEGVSFKSKGTVGLPADLTANAIAVVEDNIRMGFNLDKPTKLRLVATILADLDIVRSEEHTS